MVPFSDEELTALALAADPGAPLDPEAVPMEVYLGHQGALERPELPDWYMAPARARVRSRGGRLVVLGMVGAFLAIEAVGLCSTYGQLPFH